MPALAGVPKALLELHALIYAANSNRHCERSEAISGR